MVGENRRVVLLVIVKLPLWATAASRSGAPPRPGAPSGRCPPSNSFSNRQRQRAANLHTSGGRSELRLDRIWREQTGPERDICRCCDGEAERLQQPQSKNCLHKEAAAERIDAKQEGEPEAPQQHVMPQGGLPAAPSRSDMAPKALAETILIERP
jgi:hypothetical protein